MRKLVGSEGSTKTWFIMEVDTQWHEGQNMDL